MTCKGSSFDHPVKGLESSNENLRKMTTSKEMLIQQGVYWIIHTSRNIIKIIQINVNKQKAFDSDPRLKQQIDFTGSLDRNGNTMLFV